MFTEGAAKRQRLFSLIENLPSDMFAVINDFSFVFSPEFTLGLRGVFFSIFGVSNRLS